MKSLDFEGETIDAAFNRAATEAKVIGNDGDPKVERCIDFDAFITIVLSEYKDKDTMDGLLAAFRTLADG